MDQELVQYLGERFQNIDERFQQREQRFNARFDAIDRRFEAIGQRFERQEHRFNARFDALDQRIEEVKRHTGVLVEGLRQEIHLVAEGLMMHIQVQHVQEREYFDRKFDDTHALIRSSYDHLQQQQDQTRQRVENLERKPPNYPRSPRPTEGEGQGEGDHLSL